MAFGVNMQGYTAPDKTEYDPLPAGKYAVIVDQCEECVSKASGKDMLKLTLSVVGNAQGRHRGAKLFYYIVDNDGAQKKIWRFFQSAGAPVPPMANAASFLHKVAYCSTEVEEYNGRKDGKVKFFFHPRENDPDEAPLLKLTYVPPKDLPDTPAEVTDDCPF